VTNAVTIARRWDSADHVVRFGAGGAAPRLRWSPTIADVAVVSAHKTVRPSSSGCARPKGARWSVMRRLLYPHDGADLAVTAATIVPGSPDRDSIESIVQRHPNVRWTPAARQGKSFAVPVILINYANSRGCGVSRAAGSAARPGAGAGRR